MVVEDTFGQWGGGGDFNRNTRVSGIFVFPFFDLIISTTTKNGRGEFNLNTQILGSFFLLFYSHCHIWVSTLKVWHHKFSFEFFHLLPRRIDSVSLTNNQ